jgi:hypothetical protein
MTVCIFLARRFEFARNLIYDRLQAQDEQRESGFEQLNHLLYIIPRLSRVS